VANDEDKGALAMKEDARKQRNTDRLKECFPAFATRVRAVITDLESRGFRPRIQDAHRSIADQEKAFKEGHSKVKFGYHNVTGAGGKAESLAVDLLDDDNPLNPPRKYVINLVSAARTQGLHSGAFFGLTANLKKGLESAADALDISPGVKIGWDPTHLEVSGISIAEAKAGKRPA
jgi:hypothetical protein